MTYNELLDMGVDPSEAYEVESADCPNCGTIYEFKVIGEYYVDVNEPRPIWGCAKCGAHIPEDV